MQNFAGLILIIDRWMKVLEARSEETLYISDLALFFLLLVVQTVLLVVYFALWALIGITMPLWYYPRKLLRQLIQLWRGDFNAD